MDKDTGARVERRLLAERTHRLDRVIGPQRPARAM
jgi:hypothetical protein